MSADNSFASRLDSMGWNRASIGNQSDGRSFLDRINPFSDHGYMRLPLSNDNAQLPASNPETEQEAYFTLSRWDRLLVFGACIAGAAVCFLVAFLFAPVLALKPRKFVTLWTVGSILFLCSFAALQGPTAYLQHLVSRERLPFTLAYFGSLGLTLYFSIGLQNLILTLISGVVQVVCLLWYLVSYFPLGTQGFSWTMRYLQRRLVNSFS